MCYFDKLYSVLENQPHIRPLFVHFFFSLFSPYKISHELFDLRF